MNEATFMLDICVLCSVYSICCTVYSVQCTVYHAECIRVMHVDRESKFMGFYSHFRFSFDSAASVSGDVAIASIAAFAAIVVFLVAFLSVSNFELGVCLLCFQRYT